MNTEWDSLLYIHAPWCGHCKSIEPVISAVAKLHEKDNSVFRVYRVDGTRNDINHPAIRVKGFPVIYFFKGSDLMNPIEYDGERTVQAIESFVNTFRRTQQSTNSAEEEGSTETTNAGDIVVDTVPSVL